MTLSWIFENLVDHEADVDSHCPIELTPRRATCPVCHEDGPFDGWLVEHLRSRHPLQPPGLYLEGQHARRTHPVRKPLSAADILVTNTTEILLSLDGGTPVSVDFDGLVAALADIDHLLADIELVNRRADGPEARRTFRVRVDVVEATTLDAVDTAFQETVGPDPTPAMLDRFAAAARKTGAASYADALYGFVCGLLEKDRVLAGAGFPFAQHRDRLLGALSELSAYPGRPLARAAAGVARFNVNDFHHPWLVSGMASLDTCAVELRSLIGASDDLPPASNGPTEGPGCPVDRTTDALVRTFSAGLSSDDWRATEVTLLRLASSPETTPADAAKARALALARAARHRGTEQRRAADALVNDPLFGPFAIGLLRT